MSDVLTESNIFNLSNYFSDSLCFSFSNTFTNSETFTPTQKFSPSNIFSLSDIFTDSYSFRPTPTESVFGQSMMMSMSYSHTYKLVKTVIFQNEYISKTCTVCYSNSQCEILNRCPTLIPYIIYSYSPVFVFSPVYFFYDAKKKTITQVQLIGVVSGSAAVLFALIGIVIIFKNKKSPYEEVSSQDDSPNGDFQTETKTTQVEMIVTINSIENEDIDNWL